MTYRTVVTVTLALETPTSEEPESLMESLRVWAAQSNVLIASLCVIHDQLDWSLYDSRLGFSTRVINALTRPRRKKREHGWALREYPEDCILTIRDLVSRDARTLLEYRSFGDTSLAEVRMVLARYGLYLLGENRQPPRNS